jgi:hypothetical protein
MTSPSDRLALYTDLFLSTKKKYKPVAKKVHPVIGELPEKFCIERKIIGNPLDDLPILNPNPPPFQPSDRYTFKRRNQLDKNHPGDFLWPAERDLMHIFMLAHDSGFAWSEQERCQCDVTTPSRRYYNRFCSIMLNDRESNTPNRNSKYTASIVRFALYTSISLESGIL